MRINLRHVETSTNSNQDVINLIKQQIPNMDCSDISISVMPNDYDHELITLIKDIEGVEQVDIGTISRPFGMGGCYGQGVTVYIEDSQANSLIIDDHPEYPSVLINTEAFLTGNFEERDDIFQLLENKYQDHEDWDDYSDADVAHFLAKDLGLHVIDSDNTANRENDLSNEINYTLVSSNEFDWPCGDKIFLVARIHQGGDVRGNYSRTRIFDLGDYDSACRLFDICVEFYFSEQDRDDEDHYTNGYTNNPMYDLFETYDIILVDKSSGKATLEHKETKERVKGYFSASID